MHRTNRCPRDGFQGDSKVMRHKVANWRFAKIEVPLVIIHLNRILYSKNHPAFGGPPFMETLHVLHEEFRCQMVPEWKVQLENWTLKLENEDIADMTVFLVIMTNGRSTIEVFTCRK